MCTCVIKLVCFSPVNPFFITARASARSIEEYRRVEGKLFFLPDTGNLGIILSFPWDISKSQLEEMTSELKKNKMSEFLSLCAFLL